MPARGRRRTPDRPQSGHAVNHPGRTYRNLQSGNPRKSELLRFAGTQRRWCGEVTFGTHPPVGQSAAEPLRPSTVEDRRVEAADQLPFAGMATRRNLRTPNFYFSARTCPAARPIVPSGKGRNTACPCLFHVKTPGSRQRQIGMPGVGAGRGNPPGYPILPVTSFDPSSESIDVSSLFVV